MQFDLKVAPLYETTNNRKRKSIPKTLKESVWRKYFGNRMTGKCYVCKKHIDWTTSEIGHNRAVASGGGTNLGNLRPICRSCNRSMGKMSIETFKKKYFSKSRPKKRTKKQKIKRRTSNLLEFPSIKYPIWDTNR